MKGRNGLFLTLQLSQLPLETASCVSFPTNKPPAFSEALTSSYILTPCQPSPCINDPTSKPLTFSSPLNLKRCFSIGSDQNSVQPCFACVGFVATSTTIHWPINTFPWPLWPQSVSSQPAADPELLLHILVGLNSCPLPQTINVPFSSSPCPEAP